MTTVKLIKDGKVIERSKVDYEYNQGNWEIRGWSLYEGKPKAQPKPAEEPKKAKPKKKGK
tara:strand:- start:568 stop:747 length:180 start_codon:yes stop_codon:yes gene_type:complete